MMKINIYASNYRNLNNLKTKKINQSIFNEGNDNDLLRGQKLRFCVSVTKRWCVKTILLMKK